MKSTLKKITVALSLFLLCFPAFAKKEDAKQPINIVSDNQSLDLEKNIVTFSQNVLITQGSIEIKADKVLIIRPQENNKNQKEQIKALGQPVTFKQTLDNGKLIQGNANTVLYDLTTEVITLTGKAQLQQRDSKINGHVITYNVKQQKLKAFANKQDRVKTVLYPDQLK